MIQNILCESILGEDLGRLGVCLLAKVRLED